VTAKTPAERQKAYRERRKAEGYEWIRVRLDPDVAAALKGKTHTDKQEIINRALRAVL
jgi:uncharacterized protein (DUF4415 family)